MLLLLFVNSVDFLMYAQIETLRQLLIDLSEIEVLVDPQEPQTFVSPTTQGQLFIEIRSGAMLGDDEFTRVYDAVTNKQIVTQKGNRLFTLTVRMESYDSTSNAYETLEKIRNRLRRPSSLARLRAEKMTVYETQPVVSLPTKYDNRVISAANFDLHMALFFTDIDTTDDGIWVETVELINELVP